MVEQFMIPHLLTNLMHSLLEGWIQYFKCTRSCFGVHRLSLQNQGFRSLELYSFHHVIDNNGLRTTNLFFLMLVVKRLLHLQRLGVMQVVRTQAAAKLLFESKHLG